METKQLDNMSKILLATQTINYLANQLNAVNEQIKMIPKKPENAELNSIVDDGIKDRDAFLTKVVTDLTKVMENIGNVMNNIDCIAEIDIRATTAAFDILVHGKDNVDE